MGLVAVLASIDDLSDDLKKLYKKRDDGKWQLDVEGLVDKAKVDEFRQTNISQKAQIEQLTEQLAAFTGIDPVKVKELMQKLENDDEKKLIKEGKIEEVVAGRVAKMKAEYDAQIAAKDKLIKAAQDDTSRAKQELDNYMVETELRKAVDNPDMGFQPGVADLLKREVLSQFRSQDGKVVRVDKDGKLVYGKNGDPATISEFLADVVKDRGYLVKASGGGGAAPTKSNQTNGKTIKRADWDKLDGYAQGAKMKEGFSVVD